MNDALTDRAYAIWEKNLAAALSMTPEGARSDIPLHRWRVIGLDRPEPHRIEVTVEIFADYPYNRTFFGLDDGDAVVVLRIDLLSVELAEGIYAPESPLHLFAPFLIGVSEGNAHPRTDPSDPIVVDYDY